MSKLRYVLILMLGAVLVFTAAMALLHGKLREPNVITVVDTVDNAYLRARLATQSQVLADVFNENDGLRGALQRAENRIRGLEARRPDTVLVAADLVDVRRDTLARPVIAVHGGLATYAVLIPRVDSLHEERLLAGVDVRDCDDGYVFGAEGAACNRAVLGHLSLLARARVSTPAHSIALTRPPPLEPVGELVLSWSRCFRCTFGAEVGVDTRRRLTAAIHTGVRAF